MNLIDESVDYKKKDNSKKIASPAGSSISGGLDPA